MLGKEIIWNFYLLCELLLNSWSSHHYHCCFHCPYSVINAISPPWLLILRNSSKRLKNPSYCLTFTNAFRTSLRCFRGLERSGFWSIWLQFRVKIVEPPNSDCTETKTAPTVSRLTVSFGGVHHVLPESLFGREAGLLNRILTFLGSYFLLIFGFMKCHSISLCASWGSVQNTPSSTGRTSREKSAWACWRGSFDPSEAPGTIVEIDESKVGKRKYHRGRQVDGAWIFGGIERGNPQRCFLERVPDRTAATLIPLVKKYIKPGTKILSDCWRPYDQLEKEGFAHESVNHSIEFVSETGVHTQTIESTWRAVKRTLPSSGGRPEMLDSYLAEFLFRRRYLTDAHDKFLTFLSKIKVIYAANQLPKPAAKKRKANQAD